MPVPSRITYDTRVSAFHAGRPTRLVSPHLKRGDQLRKERSELLRKEEKNDRKRGCPKVPCKKTPKRKHKLITEDSSNCNRPTTEIEGNFMDADPTTGTI